MIYTEKIKKAIKFATKTHEVYQQQKRKGKDIPYITHPLIVGLILSRAGASEDVIVAGILHDTIEDSKEPKKVTVEMLTGRFGENVAQLVSSVTEHDKTMSWQERKDEAFEHIKSFTNDQVLVKSGDVISNLNELIEDIKLNGDEAFASFKGTKEQWMSHSTRVINALISQWPESPLAADLATIGRQLKLIDALGSEVLVYVEAAMRPYLDEEQQKTRRIALIQCEDEEGCGFFVEFEHPNCTLFFCKEHKMGFNVDLATVSEAGVECKQHGKMERYDILLEDNVCPSCEKKTLAILSVPSHASSE